MNSNPVALPRWCLAFVVGAIALQLVLAITHAFIGDDGYIAFRYARNLAEGLGLRFNPGEEPPVEGYTQLGWVLAVAVVERLGLDTLTTTRVMEISSGLVLAALVARRAWKSWGMLASAAAALFMATSPIVAVWSTGGLGTMPFALALFASADFLLGADRARNTVWTALACCAVTVLRFDGLWFVGVVLAGALLAARLTNRPQLMRRAFVVGAIVAASFAVQTGWRLWYHEDWLPNTARAKLALSSLTLLRGWHYAVSTWYAMPALFLALVWATVRTFARPTDGTNGDRHGRTTVVCAVLVGNAVHVVLTSGDFMPMLRFFVPSIPFAALAVASLVHVVERRSGRVYATASAVVAIALSAIAFFGWSPIPVEWRKAAYFRWKLGYRPEITVWRHEEILGAYWASVGRAMALHVDPSESIVRGPIGAIGYHSRLTVYDQYGLTDREVVRAAPRLGSQMSMPGHDTFVPVEFFADRKPTYVRAELYLGMTEESPEYAAFVAGIGELRDRSVLHPVKRSDGFDDDGFLVLELGVFP